MMKDQNILTLQTLGVFNSVFRQKFGTPRQSGFTELARGKVEISKTKIEFNSGDYYWIIFIFHKDLKLNNSSASHFDSNQKAMKKGKIKPPKLFGDKMGVFATRSPHRFNPIGISIGQVYKTHKTDDSTIVYFSGLDLVHETPIMAIIPYQINDSIKELKIPDWLEETKEEKLLNVEFTDSSILDIQNLINHADGNKLEFYDSTDDV